MMTQWPLLCVILPEGDIIKRLQSHDVRGGEKEVQFVDENLEDHAIGQDTHLAYFEQEQLGWEQGLRGRLSKSGKKLKTPNTMNNTRPPI